MDIEKLIEQLRTESLYADKASLEIMDLCMDAATGLSTLQTELDQVKRERDAARAALAEQTGLADGSVRTLFGVPLDRMRELAKAELAGRIVLRSAGAGKKCGSCGHWHRIHDTRRGTCDVRRWLRDRYGASEPGTAFIPTQSYGACRDYIPREDDNHG